MLYRLTVFYWDKCCIIKTVCSLQCEGQNKNETHPNLIIINSHTVHLNLEKHKTIYHKTGVFLDLLCLAKVTL